MENFSEERKNLSAIVFRSLIISLLVYFLIFSFKGEGVFSYIFIAVFIGSLLGLKATIHNIKKKQLLYLFLILFLIFSLYLIGIYLFPALFAFKIYFYGQKIKYLIIAGVISFFINFILLKFKYLLYIESLFFYFILIGIFSGHRQFHFEKPIFLETIAWQFNISHLNALILSSIVLGSLVLFYLRISLYIFLKKYDRERTLFIQPNYRAEIILSFILVVLTAFIAGLINYYKYKDLSFSKTANGVGETKGEGLSPLSFHSALGSTSQPSAVVKLYSDYKENPTSPLVYFREGALSEFNGYEMVQASKEFDQDAYMPPPNIAFKRDSSFLKVSNYKKPIEQSFYLLTEHKTAFALGDTLNITPLLNPNKRRFKSAYKAYSMVPTYTFKDILKASVGNKNWSEKEKKHYLKPNPDKRYKELAEKITKEKKFPVEKMLSIINYLSKNAIYTLTPNHKLKPNQDPVEPFLFGDLRGYCVHFAHAIVYLARSLNIPARVATGYAADIRDAIDGHLLLRVSDRHAWAEIYVEDIGWVPLDVTPEKVESHAETPVDKKLLEDLINQLSIDKENLTDDLLSDENVFIKEKASRVKKIYFFLAIVVIYLTLKLILWYGYLLPFSSKIRIKLLYKAFNARFADVGLKRAFAQTKKEYEGILKNKGKLIDLQLADTINEVIYSKDKDLLLKLENINSKASVFNKEFNKISLPLRLVGFLNPMSLILWIKRKI